MKRGADILHITSFPAEETESLPGRRMRLCTILCRCTRETDTAQLLYATASTTARRIRTFRKRLHCRTVCLHSVRIDLNSVASL